MYFSKKVSGIKIYGNTPIDINTIHIKFSNNNDSFTEIIDFLGNIDTQFFKLRNIFGKYKVEFVFLPGSNFDFKWFQFL